MKPKSSLILMAVLASLALALATFSLVLATHVQIDDFAGTTPDVTVIIPPGGGPVTGTDSAAGGLGNQRDLVLTSSGTIQGQTSRLRVNNGNLDFTEDSSVTGVAEIQWDGDDGGAASIAPNGLGGVDLTGGGTNDGFHIEIRADDLPVILTVRVYSGANWSDRSVQLLGGITSGQHVDIFMPFSTFTPRAGTGADYASVGAVALVIDSAGSPGADVTIDFMDADGYRDYGDLPSSYGASVLNAGHTPSGLRLGSNVDIEAAPLPSSGADGDDLDQTPDDEDGVSLIPGTAWVPGANGGRVRVNVSGCTVNCRLYGWVDWDGNSSFAEPGDKIFPTGKGVSNGNQTFTFDIPLTAVITSNHFYARFRICTTGGGCGSYDTPASSGEVEDYLLSFNASAVSLTRLQASSHPSPTVTLYLLIAALLVAFTTLGVRLFHRRTLR